MTDRAPIVSEQLRAPFPYFGGKRRVAKLVWSRLGDVDTYNEPFFGSGAVLLARPHEPRVETVNDADCFLSNFWRALQHDPDAVAYHADSPVNEADLHARHRWLVERGRRRVLRCLRDPHYFNAKIAGWWVYGQCLWIGSGWCEARRPPVRVSRPETVTSTDKGVHRQFDRNPQGTVHQQRRPHLTCDQGILIQRHGNGANADLTVDWQPRPDLSSANGRGGAVNQRTAETRSGERPWLQHKRFAATGHGGGTGVHRPSLSQKRPGHSGNGEPGGIHTHARRWQGGGQGGGSGVHAPRLKQQIPQLSGDGSGTSRGLLADTVLKIPALSQGGNDRSGNGRGIFAGHVRSDGLYEYLYQLSARLRRVRVCCGDWRRVLTPSVTTYIGLTGVFLDPPYSHELRERCYAEDHDISAEVRAWALAHGDNPKMRIALCGYEGEHQMPASWECKAWKAHGGYSRSVRGKANRERERVWFSPHCLKPATGMLPFEDLELDEFDDDADVDDDAGEEECDVPAL